MDSYERNLFQQAINLLMEIVGYEDGLDESHKIRRAQIRLYQPENDPPPMHLENRIDKNSEDLITIKGDDDLELRYGQGSITERKRKRKNGKIYKYYEGRYMSGGQQHTVTAKTKKECLAKMKEAIKNADKRPSTPRKPTGQTTYGEWLETWYTTYKLPYKTEQEYPSIRPKLDNWVIPAYGAYKIKDITSLMLQQFISSIKKDDLRKTRSHRFGGSFPKARIHGLIKNDPAEALMYIKGVKQEKRAFTFREQQRIFCACNRKYKALFFFLCCTGLRIGEFLDLDESNIDYANCLINVETTQNIKTGQSTETTKTGLTRVVKFVPGFIEFVKEVAGGQFFGNYTYTGASKYFRKLYKKFGLKRVDLHSTRRTFASTCYYCHVPDKQTQKWLGHTTISMTLDIYTELYSDGTSIIKEYIERLKNTYCVP